jgi:hypothetical protein
MEEKKNDKERERKEEIVFMTEQISASTSGCSSAQSQAVPPS